jgi:hypothetical protein
MRDRAGRARVRDRIITRIALEIPLYLRAQRFIDHARLRKRILDQRDGKGPLEDGLVRENQHPLDLPLHLGF